MNEDFFYDDSFEMYDNLTEEQMQELMYNTMYAGSWDDFISSIVWVIMIAYSVFLLIQLIGYIFKAIGLFLINKKLGEKHAWVSFIPVVQIYNYFTVSKKSFLAYFVLPIFVAFLCVIGWWMLAWMTWNMFYLIVLYIVWFAYFIIRWVQVLHWISIRTGRWKWTTVWLLLIPYIMFPIVGFKLKKSLTEEVKDKAEEIKNELSDEL